MASMFGTSLFEIMPTAKAGRGAFASANVAAGTPLLETAEPVAFFIHRRYRKEVCAQCFVYNNGETLPHQSSNIGASFCSKACLYDWHQQDGTLASSAFGAVEALIKRKWKGDCAVLLTDAERAKPCVDSIALVWKLAEQKATGIISARQSRRPVKQDLRNLEIALAAQPVPHLLNYSTSAVCAASCSPGRWSEVMDLCEAPTPYTNFSELNDYVTTYHHLLATLPVALLPYCTPPTLLGLAGRDAHNAFGLRSLDDGGSECFGAGIWPEASYWNHSCAPNVEKERVGRRWRFWAKRDVKRGEELCITYLGGEEQDIGVRKRREALKGIWEFECACRRCVDEED